MINNLTAKWRICLLAAFSPITLFSSATTAQDWQSEVDRINLDRQQSLGRMADQARTESLVAEQAETLGLIRIRSGKAKTTFVPTANGFVYVLNFMTFDPSIDSNFPQTKPGQIKYLQDLVTRFEARMIKAGGYKLNDNGDAANFACLLSYEAYYDKKATGKILADFQQMRIDDRKTLLGAAYYEGFGDERKQKMYILDATQSQQAIEWREKARAAKTETERQSADAKAKYFADYKLKLNVNANQAKTNAAPVKAATIFNRNHGLLLSESKMVSTYFAFNGEYFRNLMSEFDAEVLRRGGQTNDLAWTNAVAFVYAYQVYTDNQVQLSDQQVKWMVTEMTKDILAHQELQVLSNDDKQRYYETVALNSIVLYDSYRKALVRGFSKYHTREQKLAEAADICRNIFTPRKFDEYKLTANGFVQEK